MGSSEDVLAARFGLATNTLRPQGFLRGRVKHVERVREVLGALHGVVVSDLKRRPKDREAWQRWLAEQDKKFIATLKAKSEGAQDALMNIDSRLAVLDERRRERRAEFVKARAKYAEYVVRHSGELLWLYDPVVTVHPDEVFFEAFSKDESSYARVGLSRSLFHDEGDVVFGTTNIDFSAALARHLERLRSYRDTTLSIGPSGVEVQTGDAVHREAKIPLPESWVNGFLQVQATATMALTEVRLDPIALHSALRVLVQKKARTSPKALCFELLPGKPVRMVLEPWEQPVDATTVYRGDKAQSVRLWGRERLKLLGRLLPLATDVRVYLAGLGLPSFWIFDLGGISFTLGLSGWTDNDWTGQHAKEKGGEQTRFELLTRRLDGTPEELMQVYSALREARVASDDAVATASGLPLEKTRTVLSLLAQAGRATYDLRLRQYRHRDLFVDSFSLLEAKQVTRQAPASESGKKAQQIFDGDGVRIIMRRPTPPEAEKPGYKLSGSVKGLRGEQVRPQLHVDSDGSIITGSCTCKAFSDHGLTKGPCEHLLALRLAHMDKL